MEELAGVYARSLFEVAQEHDTLDEIKEELDAFADALEENHDMQVLFFSPYFDTEAKKEGIHTVVEDGDEHFVRFLELLADRHRLPVLPRIRRAFEDLWREERGLLEVKLTSAIELDEDTVEQVKDRIEEETGRTVEISASVDDDLIGGLVIRVGNTIIDASVRNKLERLRTEVAAA